MAVKTRLQSLDIVRGFTVAGMILVNNGHSGSFETLRHAQWNGLTLCDLVFPFFLFIMGVSIYLSFSSRGFKLTVPTFWKVAKRTVLLLLLGLLINWFDKAIAGNILCFETLRYWAVLQRIALCYFIVCMIALTVNHRYILWIVGGLLLGYGTILIVGHGYDYDASTNILARVDLSLFGYDHIYHKSPVDPEGLLGTMSAVVNVLLGFYCGKQIKRNQEIVAKTEAVLLAGAVMLIIGFVVSYALPLNKRVWSPSYALVSSGFCALLLGVVMKLVDNGKPQPAVAKCLEFFKVFGVNALVLYIFSEFFAIVIGEFGLSDWWFGVLSSTIPVAQFSSLAYAISLVLICFAVGYPLYKKKIYIKL